MKNTIKHIGIIAIIAIIVFSMAGCGGDGDEGDTGTGTVKVVNNSSSSYNVGVYDEKYIGDSNGKGTSHSSYINPGNSRTFHGVKADKNYFVAVTSGSPDFNFLYKSSIFSVPKDMQVTVNFSDSWPYFY